jgi:hypothetical protein
MDCLTQHRYQFTNTNRHNWFNLLCKYHYGIKVTMKVDDAFFDGKISQEFFNSLPSGTNYELTTERFLAEYAAIRAMPKFIKSEVKETNEKIKNISSTIDALMSNRLSREDQDIFLCGEFSNDDFDQIIQSIPHLRTKEISHIYIGPNYLLFTLNSRYIIKVADTCVADGTLPAFDLGEGFLSDKLGFAKNIADEWNISFRDWLQMFNATDGDNWDAQII